LSENWQSGPGDPYAGQPPQGDPYAGQPHDPYGNPYPQQPGGYGDPAGYPPPPGGHGDPATGPVHHLEPYAAPYQEAPPSQTSAIAALVVSILLVVTCCGFLGVIGLVFSALSLTEKVDREKARRHLRYAWISNGVILAVMAVLACLIGFAIAVSET
jgi:hypothetical protein